MAAYLLDLGGGFAIGAAAASAASMGGAAGLPVGVGVVGSGVIAAGVVGCAGGRAVALHSDI